LSSLEGRRLSFADIFAAQAIYFFGSFFLDPCESTD
jgi:hypothetical protein